MEWVYFKSLFVGKTNYKNMLVLAPCYSNNILSRKILQKQKNTVSKRQVATFAAQVTAPGPGSPQFDPKTPHYSESSMDRFNRGGSQPLESQFLPQQKIQVVGDTPQTGSALGTPMEATVVQPVVETPNTNEALKTTPVERVEKAAEAPTVEKPPAEAEHAEEEEEIPDQGSEDEESPEEKQPPEKQLTPSAVDKRLRRIMTPTVRGSYKVPESVIEQWKDLQTRCQVMSMFEKCGYSPDWCWGNGSKACVGLWWKLPKWFLTTLCCQITLLIQWLNFKLFSWLGSRAVGCLF